jgi:DNA-binding MarR family transcriptional regulator
MDQIITGVPAQETPFHTRADAATVADITRPPLPTVTQYDHVAAAAYLMKHAGTTALIVTDAQTGQPAGLITEADIARAIADGKDLNDIRVHAVMTTRPALTTSIGDAATNMTARHFRHPPVARSEPGHPGLTPPQYPVLSAAAAEPGLSGAELARDCMLTPQATSEIISRLAAAGLLQRRPDPRDRRGLLMAVTEAGRDLLSRAAQAPTVAQASD